MGTTVNSFSISVIIPAYNAEKTIIRAVGICKTANCK